MSAIDGYLRESTPEETRAWVDYTVESSDADAIVRALEVGVAPHNLWHVDLRLGDYGEALYVALSDGEVTSLPSALARAERALKAGGRDRPEWWARVSQLVACAHALRMWRAADVVSRSGFLGLSSIGLESQVRCAVATGRENFGAQFLSFMPPQNLKRAAVAALERRDMAFVAQLARASRAAYGAWMSRKTCSDALYSELLSRDDFTANSRDICCDIACREGLADRLGEAVIHGGLPTPSGLELLPMETACLAAALVAKASPERSQAMADALRANGRGEIADLFEAESCRVGVSARLTSRRLRPPL